MFPLRDHEPSQRFPIVTIGLIVLNAVVFLLEATSLDIDAFIARYALLPSELELPDFLTSQFLHAGLVHVGSNMWYLWIFGDNVEGHLGHLTFLLFYLASGVVAAIAELPFLAGLPIPMLGASGAVAGALGAYWALFPHHKVDALVPHFGFWVRATLPAGPVLFLWFFMQVFNGTASVASGLSAMGGVAWFAHIGGFAFGWAVGKITAPRKRHSSIGW